jgi:hypothetical protein
VDWVRTQVFDDLLVAVSDAWLAVCDNQWRNCEGGVGSGDSRISAVELLGQGGGERNIRNDCKRELHSSASIDDVYVMVLGQFGEMLIYACRGWRSLQCPM